MKFDNHKYFKHDNCTDVFIRIKNVSFDDDSTHAIVYGYWMVQGTSGFWCASNIDRIFIKSEEYEKWKPYSPINTERYV